MNGWVYKHFTQLRVWPVDKRFMTCICKVCGEEVRILAGHTEGLVNHVIVKHTIPNLVRGGKNASRKSKRDLGGAGRERSEG
jgi:hypothetical protein